MFALDPFSLKELLFEKIAGGARVYDLEGNLLLYAERKGMSKLGKDIHVYPSKYSKREVLTIKPLQKTYRELVFHTWPVGLEFEVIEPSKGVLGIIKQRKLVRLINDEWLIEVGDEIMAKIEEASLIRHLIRSYFFPAKYQIISNGKVIGTFQQLQQFTPFRFHMKIEDRERVNPKLLISWGILYSMLSVRF